MMNEQICRERIMKGQRPVDPLHGVTLKMIVSALVEHYGWEQLGRLVEIRCFTHNPSIPSTLKFLRKTPWARDKVETLFLMDLLATHTDPAESSHM